MPSVTDELCEECGLPHPHCECDLILDYAEGYWKMRALFGYLGIVYDKAELRNLLERNLFSEAHGTGDRMRRSDPDSPMLNYTKYAVFNADELDAMIEEQTEIRAENWLMDTNIECPVPGGLDIMQAALEDFVYGLPGVSAWDAFTCGQHSSAPQGCHDFKLSFETPDGECFEWTVFVEHIHR